MGLINRLRVVAIGLVVVFTSAIIVANATDSRDSVSNRRLQNKSERRQKTGQFRNETNRNWVRSRAVGGNEGGRTPSFESSIFRDGSVLRSGPVAFSASAPSPSPGQEIGFTSWDAQAISSQGYQVARTPSGSRIHFTWMTLGYNVLPPPNGLGRDIRYSGYDDIGDYPNMDAGTGYNGLSITGEMNYGGYSGIDVDKLNHAQIAMQQAENDYTMEPYEPWHVQFLYGDETGQWYALSGYDNSCPGSGGGRGGVLWPRIAADRGDTILHEIAHSNITDCPEYKLWYWRFDGGSIWSGPKMISATDDISYALAVDDIGPKVAVAYFKTVGDYTNLFYVESNNNGTDWLALAPPNLPAENSVTTYGVDGNPGSPITASAWNHITATYDRSSELHIVWDEQREASETFDIAIKHFRTGRIAHRTVTLGYWDNPVSNGLGELNLTKMSMGIGDGSTLCQGGAQSNDNYVYVTYTQFGGNTASQLADYSDEAPVAGRTGGYMNGEIVLASSNTRGDTWSPPVNLTNTKTPGCNPGLADIYTGLPANPDNVCRSEHWATIGRVVRDIDILFISDLDAGGIPYGEGSWQLNPVHYLKIPGGTTNAQYVCPAIAPVFEATLSADPLCEYHATRFGSTAADLTIMNLGNATLNQGTGAGITLTDFPGLPTLNLTGYTLGSYSIAAGSADIIMTATMTSNNAAEGLYLGQISISHNAATAENPSPRIYPVEFFVYDEFFCPQDIILKTGVASPGSLALAVESSGRFGSQEDEGGLWRFSDSSSSIYDASLLMAHGTQMPDTTVFLRFFDRLSNGQNGFRSQSELWVDTLCYGWGTQAYASAGTYMTTRDSIMGINVSWYFPQYADADEVVIVNYLVFPGPKATLPVSGVTTGLLADLDVLPAQRHPIDTMQDGVNNHGIADDSRKLVYVRGVNRPGMNPTSQNTAERFRAGIAVPSSSDFTGSYIGNNIDNQIGGGPTDGHLYWLLQNVSGVEVSETDDTDLYVMVGFDNGQTYQTVPETYRTTTVRSHYAILVSDTLDDASFKAKVDAAAALVNGGAFDGCAICPCRYDSECDGRTDIVDVVHVIDGAFRNVVADPAILGGPAWNDGHPNQAGCNFDSRDLNCSGAPDQLDVGIIINVAFRNVSPYYRNQFVDPCVKWKP